MSRLLLLLLALDGGVSLDAGAALDAGVPDAGPRVRWTHDKGEWLNDAGVTDVLVLHLRDVAEVKFPFPIVLMQCDEPLLTLGANEDTLLLTGAKTGRTRCGFWFDRRAWPHRTMDVAVLP